VTPDTLASTHAAAFTTDRPWSAAEFANLLSHPSTLLTGDARAFVLARVILDEAEILTLATHPAHRRQGLARAALDTFITAAARRGATRAFLDVAEDNAPARALYAATGFSEIARRPGYYHAADGPSRDAIILARDLPASDPDA
jgi:ribosomal-protein-alanine N-acetyltransferase